jgi:hemolysin activation/secretion protein
VNAPASQPAPSTASSVVAAAPVQKTEPAPAAKPQAEPERKPAAAPVLVQGSLDSAAPADSVATAEDAAAAALRFDIARYLVVGNTILKPAEISGALRNYTGRQKDFADVQRALEVLQTAYSDRGYSAVQVTLPEQELERGEVRFEVIETRIGKIEIQGNELHNEKNVRASLPSLREGSTPNSLEIARSLKLANENASKQTQVSLRSGSQDGEVDAVIKLIEDNPVKYTFSMDNTGTYASGKYRTGFGYQNSNFLNRDHTLTLQYITSPEHPSAVTVFGLGYRLPLYGSGNSIDLVAGYSDVSSGTVSQLFNVSGAGTVLGARYNMNFDRVENYEHKIVFGLDYKAFQSNVTFVGSSTPLVPDVTVHPVSITYSGLWRGTTSQLDFFASYSQNIPGGNDGAQSDFNERKTGYPNPARTDAKAGYNILRAGANYTHQMWGEWQARTSLNIQQTDAALIAGEQFGAGGAESVRGFDERAISNDRGWRANFELYTPDIAGDLGWTGGRAKVLVFYDTADLTRNRRQPGEASGQTISSYGLGLRVQTKNVFSMKVDYAQVYHDSETDNGTPRLIKDGRRNSNTVHASANWVF